LIQVTNTGWILICVNEEDKVFNFCLNAWKPKEAYMMRTLSKKPDSELDATMKGACY
jgi:hypothetical protein